MTTKHIFTGFGFGPIQSGLFVKEAFDSGNFDRIVVAEIDAALVEALRASDGAYYVNIACSDCIEVARIEGVELLNPSDPADKADLVDALAASTEIVTSLPSVDFFTAGGPNSVASLIASAIAAAGESARIIYTAENNNHAAEILRDAVAARLDLTSVPVRFLNTVIGKMSRVVTDPDEIRTLQLKPIAPGIDRAFLVEQFNHILVTRTTLDDLRPGIEVFVEKDDLLPFEEAKLYGHNAIHAQLAYLAALKGCVAMTELKSHPALMDVARSAFVDESGAALIAKYAALGDPLFSAAGYRDYAEDLLCRMTNPYLGDTVARAGRDVLRKLGPDDRIIGTMDLALQYGIEPTNMALGAAAAVAALLSGADEYDLPADIRVRDIGRLTPAALKALTDHIWSGKQPAHAAEINDLILKAADALPEILA